MRLLITTQAVDLDDPVLGFFHRWLEEFSKQCESVHVMCLKEGRHALPANVFVHSLGKESGRSRLKYLANFYRNIWTLRREYDAVFVHMNQEYVLLGWTPWRLWGKRIVLWRNHKQGSLATRIAALMSYAVCYTSPEAYAATYKNAVRMPIGIDTEVFKPSADAPASRSILFLGRFDAVKKVDVFVDALQKLAQEQVEFHAGIFGDPTEPFSAYASRVRKQGEPLVARGFLTFHPGVTHAEAAALYRAHAIYVNLTPSGSFDKTIGEAMACGALVVCGNDAVREVVPKELFARALSPQAVQDALKTALPISSEQRQRITEAQRQYILSTHSLVLLADELMRILRVS